YPGLPQEVPLDAKPTGFQYIGVPCWLALCEVLNRLSCAVAPRYGGKKPWQIVYIGTNSDQYNDRIIQNIPQKKLFYDAYPVGSNRTKFPSRVAVFFNKFYENYGSEITATPTAAQWQTKSVVYYIIDPVNDLGLVLKNPQICVHPIWDDE